MAVCLCKRASDAQLRYRIPLDPPALQSDIRCGYWSQGGRSGGSGSYNEGSDDGNRTRMTDRSDDDNEAGRGGGFGGNDNNNDDNSTMGGMTGGGFGSNDNNNSGSGMGGGNMGGGGMQSGACRLQVHHMLLLPKVVCRQQVASMLAAVTAAAHATCVSSALAKHLHPRCTGTVSTASAGNTTAVMPCC